MSDDSKAVKQPARKDLRIFSLIWSAIFLTIGTLPIASGGGVRAWALVPSGVFLAVGFICPEIVSGFYKIWVKFGEFVGGIISKAILVLLFFGLIFPYGLLFKIVGKDPLKRKQNPKPFSYWILRETQPGSLKNQY